MYMIHRLISAFPVLYVTGIRDISDLNAEASMGQWIDL